MRQIFNALPWFHPPEHERIVGFYRRHGRPVRIRRGEIVKGGAQTRKLFFLEEGLCAYLVNYDLGRASMLSLIVPGRTIGDITTLTGDRVNVVTRALRDSTLLEIPPETLSDVVFAQPDAAMLVTRSIVAKQESHLEGMIANFTMRPPERLRVFLKALAVTCGGGVAPGWNPMPIALNNEELGCVIHATRVTVSRTISGWIDAGLARREQRVLSLHASLFDGIYDWLDSSRA